MATFGEMAGRAELYLDAAITGPAMALGQEAVLAAGHELHRLTLTLSRYLRDVAPYDEVEAVTSQELPGWVPAAVDAREALQLAAASLPAEPGPVSMPATEPADPMVARLAAAAASLSAGRDLLHTHVVPEAEGAWLDRSEWAAVVRSEPVTRAVLEEVARWSRKLTLVADALSIACAVHHASPAPEHLNLGGARNWLLTSTSALQKATRSNPATAVDTELLIAIPANMVPGRRLPQPRESIADLTEGIVVSASRLRVIAAGTTGQAAWSPAATTESWKQAATAAAIVAHLSEHMLRSIAGRASQWQNPVDAGLLQDAAEVTAQACARWQEVVVAWGDLCTETRGLNAPGITDTSDLVLRVGRLAFTDPDWTPSQARSAAPLRAPADLAPDPAQAAALVRVLHQAADALARVAAAALRDVGAAAGAGRLYVPTRTLPPRRDIFYPYWHAAQAAVDAVLSAYQEVVQTSRQAAVALGAAAVRFDVPRAAMAPRMAVAGPAQSASADRAAAGPAEDTGITRSVPASGLPGTVTEPPAGPAEQALRRLGSADPLLLLRAKAIDKAGRKLISEARNESAGIEGSGHVRGISAPAKAAESFPRDPRALSGPAAAARRGGTQSWRPRRAPTR